ncbi:Frag1/DRAM/Sfk1 family-domain-containing protein [Powellomyces hirtus]|nr:Frag1/DRAM/Sfk1 family-domain-containing protein [Powellomyces hirtus]
MSFFPPILRVSMSLTALFTLPPCSVLPPRENSIKTPTFQLLYIQHHIKPTHCPIRQCTSNYPSSYLIYSVSIATMSRFLGWAWVPFLAAFWWLATILALLILWLVNDTPHYKQDDADIVYISDVGAKYKTLFIVGTSLTSAFFVTSLLLDYILRKAHRLSAPIHPRARINAILSILFGMIAGAALIGLAVMDVHNHGTVHWTLTLVFMGCLSVSAIFTVAEFKRLKNDHHGKSHLKRSFFVKAMIVVLAVAAVIAMVVLRQLCRTEDWRSTPDAPRCNALHSASAICEWVVALLFVVYLLTLVVDIRQAVYTSKTYMDGGEMSIGRRQSSQATMGGRRYY